MSKIALQGDASGTGTFTIASPNSNTDRTLTLPDEAGTVLTSVSSIPVANLDSAVGITDWDQWRPTSDQGYSHTDVIDTGWERADIGFFEKGGTGMSESSGVFTFPSTGYWQVTFIGTWTSGGVREYVGANIEISDNSGSTFSEAAVSYDAITSGGDYGAMQISHIVKVTNASNFRARFRGLMQNDSTLKGTTNYQYSGAQFIKIRGL